MERVDEWQRQKKLGKKFSFDDLNWDAFGWLDFFGAERWARFTEPDREPQDALMKFACQQLRELWYQINRRAVTEFREYLRAKRPIRFIIEGTHGGWLGNMEAERQDYLRMPRWWRRKLEIERWVLPMEMPWDVIPREGEMQTELFRQLLGALDDREENEPTEEDLPRWYLEHDRRDWLGNFSATNVV